METIHRRFEDELESVVESVLRLGGMAEQAIARTVEVLQRRDIELAKKVIEEDEAVDLLELQIDQSCVEILARHQLMARDLRVITTLMKVTPDLERIADLAANICNRVIELAKEPIGDMSTDIPSMGLRAQEMLRRVLDAFGQRDADGARHVIAMDDELDRKMELSYRLLISYMLENPKLISGALQLGMVAKAFERMGDQATNIAEMVVYMSEGRVIKHMGDEGLREDAGS